MVGGEAFVDEVVDGEDGGDAVQGEEEVFGAVEEFCAGHEAVEGDVPHLPQEHGHAPRFVAPWDAPPGGVAEFGGDAPLFALVVEEGVAIRVVGQQGAGEFLAVAP